MTMGCGSSKKLLPESPSSERVVKTTLLAEGSISSRETRSSGNKNHVKRKLSEQRSRSAKYRARFDIRVTEKYDIKALIGRGSFSRVVRVEHNHTKQPYAIKMIETYDGKDVFQSELAVLRKVKHDFVVRLYEVFECRDRVYLVMELATGGELFDRIVSKGFFTERDATRVMYMVLEGVRYLHSLGITHRDLKPENLLYYHPGNDSKIMITDFGLSNLRQGPDDRTMDTTCGTPEYIAPEILMSRAYTNSVDMWAVGVITFILLSGQMPFSDESRTRLYKAILKAKYAYTGEPWNDVTDMAKDFINKLILLDPDERMTAEQGLTHPWIASSAASSSLKNLHGSISQNWLKSSSRVNSAKSNNSQNSNRSIRSVLSKHLHKDGLRLSDLKEKLAAAESSSSAATGEESSTACNSTSSSDIKTKTYHHHAVIHKVYQDGPEHLGHDGNASCVQSKMQPKMGSIKEDAMLPGPKMFPSLSVEPNVAANATVLRATNTSQHPHSLAFGAYADQGTHLMHNAQTPILTRCHSAQMDTSASDFTQTTSSLRNNFLGNFRASNEPLSKEEHINYGLEVSMNNLTANSLDHGRFKPGLSPVQKRSNRVSCSSDNYMS